MGVLEGKVAIVTGGGQGMGRGIALTLAAEGASLMLMGRTAAKLEEARSEIEGRGGPAPLTLAGDVKDPDAIERCVAQTVSELGTVDILINNAQEIVLGRLLEVSEEDNQAGWESGPVATWRMMLACHPHFGGRRRDRECREPSGHHGEPEWARTVCCSQAGYAGGSLELPPWSGHPMEFELTRFCFRSNVDSGQVPGTVQEGRGPVPTRPSGRPGADIGPAITFLVGPAAAYITGVTLPVDGGNAFLG